MKTQSLFNQLVSENNGDHFVYAIGELIEVNVNIWESMIVVCKYRRAHDLDPISKDTYHSLNGMFGRQTVEQKFNEILSSLSQTA